MRYDDDAQLVGTGPSGALRFWQTDTQLAIRQICDRRGDPIDARAMADLQLDERNPYADFLVERLLEIELASDFDEAGQDLLRDWDHTTPAADSEE